MLAVAGQAHAQATVATPTYSVRGALNSTNLATIIFCTNFSAETKHKAATSSPDDSSWTAFAIAHRGASPPTHPSSDLRRWRRAVAVERWRRRWSYAA